MGLRARTRTTPRSGVGLNELLARYYTEMAMERCETCQHWQRNEHVTGSEFGLGRCKAAPMFWDATNWDDEGNRSLISKYASTKAFVQDGSDYSANLLTKPDFGCVMHVSANAGINRSRESASG